MVTVGFTVSIALIVPSAVATGASFVSCFSQHYQCEIEVIDELRPDLFLRRCLGLSRKRNAHFIHHRFEDFS